MNRRILLIACSSLFLWFLCQGCQTPMADGFRKAAVPEDTVLLAATAPLTLPVYAGLSAVDVTVVNPIRGISNVPDWLYRYWNWGGSTESSAVWWSLFPFKVAGTPLVILSASAFSEQFIKE
jgi:hypothetical protein